MLVPVLALTLALLLAAAAATVVVAVRSRSGQRLESEVHTMGTAEPIDARPGLESGARDTSPRAA